VIARTTEGDKTREYVYIIPMVGTCAGLAMGIRATEIALREIGPHAGDEEIIAVVETDN
jgi:formylmethanofuran dehydrogenase subunit E